MKTEYQTSADRLGTDAIGKLILRLSLPGMASMVTFTFYNLVDTFWVARLGYEAIAAITIVLPLHLILIAFSLGSGIGISSLTSRYFGQGNTESTSHIAGHVFPISIVFGGLSIILFTLFTTPLLNIGGATPDIMDYAATYLKIVAFGSPFLIFSMVSNELLRASGDALRPMIFSITGAVINIILDPLLIFGLGPFPEMGIGGAALATVISQIISASLAFLYIIILRKSAYKIKVAHLKPSLHILGSIYSVGVPTMIIMLFESVTFVILNQVLSGFGSVALAAGGLAMRIIDFAYMPAFGASQGVLPIIGYNFGAQLYQRLWRAVKVSSLGLAAILGALAVLGSVFGPQLISVFNADAELVAQSTTSLRFFLSMVVVFGPAQMFVTAFMGMGKGRDVFWLSLVRQVALVLVLLLAPKILGLNGVWVSLPIADFVGFAAGGLWFFREYKKQKKLVFAPEAELQTS